MNDFVQVPSKGQPMTAQWGEDVANGLNAIRSAGQAGTLLTDGPTGTGFAPLPANLRDRRAIVANPLHPWKVFAVGKSKDVDHCFEIYVPEGSVHVGETALEVDDLIPVEGKSDRYTLDCEHEISESAVIYLAIVKEEEDPDGVSPDSEDGQPKWKARVVSTIESIEDAKAVLAVLPIAKLSIDDSGEYAVGSVVAQYAHSSVALSENGANPDRISIDTVTDEDAEDPDAIQLKNFDNDKSNASQGLVQRIRVVKDGDDDDSFHLEADGADLFIVARVNGALKYIPLTGSKDAGDDGVEDNPCDHPGDTPGTGTIGGVSPDDEEDHGGGGGGVVGGGGGVGGVPAGDDTHTGDPCPDCSPKS